MNGRTVSLVVALVLATLVSAGTAVYALAGHGGGAVPSITGCLTSTGKLVKLKVGDVPKQPCGAQTEVHLSGGDITSVLPAAGGGLVGGGTNGDALVGLGAGFKLPQGCSGNAIAKRSGPTDWVCGFAALGNQACPAGAVVTGINATGALLCGRSITSPNGLFGVEAADDAIAVHTPAGDLKLSNSGTGLIDVQTSTSSLRIVAAQGQITTLGSAAGFLTNIGGRTIRLAAPDEVVVETDGRVVLGGTSCPPSARRGDAVVVNTQNGVGSIVTGSTKVFAC